MFASIARDVFMFHLSVKQIPAYFILQLFLGPVYMTINCVFHSCYNLKTATNNPFCYKIDSESQNQSETDNLQSDFDRKKYDFFYTELTSLGLRYSHFPSLLSLAADAWIHYRLHSFEIKAGIAINNNLTVWTTYYSWNPS